MVEIQQNLEAFSTQMYWGALLIFSSLVLFINLVLIEDFRASNVHVFAIAGIMVGVVVTGLEVNANNQEQDQTVLEIQDQFEEQGIVFEDLGLLGFAKECAKQGAFSTDTIITRGGESSLEKIACKVEAGSDVYVLKVFEDL